MIKVEKIPILQKRKMFQVHTDGGMVGSNPGRGGWGAIIQYPNGKVLEICGGERITTNNRMEMSAAIKALEALPEGSHSVLIVTDSQYLKNGITQWIHKWKIQQWRTSSGKPVKNVDLWQKLEIMCTQHQVTWRWVRGHAGHIENERADRLAARGAKTGRAFSQFVTIE